MSPTMRRAHFPPISEEMKEWSARLESELNSWPGVSTKPMFGFLSFYRRGAIFAALPRSRGFDSPSSLILRFNPMPAALLKRAQQEARMDTNTRVPGKGWFSFQLNSPADLRDALFWLQQAYDAAKSPQ
jgi:luciferase-like monooxygenase